MQLEDMSCKLMNSRITTFNLRIYNLMNSISTIMYKRTEIDLPNLRDCSVAALGGKLGQRQAR